MIPGACATDLATCFAEAARRVLWVVNSADGSARVMSERRVTVPTMSRAAKTRVQPGRAIIQGLCRMGFSIRTWVTSAAAMVAANTSSAVVLETEVRWWRSATRLSRGQCQR